jgi:hypothetical protein
MRPLDDAPDTGELLPDLLAGTRDRTDRAKVTDALDAIDGALTNNIRPVYGMCTACGSVEVELMSATGQRDLSHMGESPNYPTGYGCEVCA